MLRRDRTLRRSLLDAACLALPGLGGMAPYLYLTARHAWLKELAALNHWGVFPLAQFGLLLGLPALLCLATYILPRSKSSPTDILLHCWFLGVLVGVHIPWAPWSQHLLDGFFYAAALLLVRQGVRSYLFRRLWAARPMLLLASMVALLAVSLAARGVMLADAVVAGRTADDYHSTVMPETDRGVRDWLRGHASPQDLLLAPEPDAGWFATVPLHSFASHWLSSLTWSEQKRLSDSFYRGELDRSAAQEILSGYGVGYVVVPEDSGAMKYFVGQTPAARIQSIAIYSRANATMRPFTDR
jgi:hypothetical protein